MKNTFFLLLIMVLSYLSVNSQTSNLICFSEEGEHFYLIINGVKQNQEPLTNVKAIGLTAPSYKIRIVFESASLPEIDKTIYFAETGMEHTYAIQNKGKGEYRLRFMNAVAAPQNIGAKGGTYDEDHSEDNDFGAGQTTTVQTTSTTVNQNGTNLGINMNENTGMGINLNISINDPNIQQNQTTTSTTTTTTTRYTESNNEQQQPNARPTEKRCTFASSSAQLAEVRQSIQSKSFEDTKLTVAQQAIKANCFTSTQIKELLTLFDFESTRLDLAKFAYTYVFDKKNYYQVNDAFEFESSIDDLNSYLQANP